MQNYTLFFSSLLFLSLFLLGAIFITSFNVAILKLGKFQTKEILKTSIFLWKNFLVKERWEKFYFLVSLTKQILYLLYAISAFLFLLIIFPNIEIYHKKYIFLIAFSIVVFFLIVEFTIRLVTESSTKSMLKVTAPITSLYISLFFILTFPFLSLSQLILRRKNEAIQTKKSFIVKEKVLEMIKDSELSTVLSYADQLNIASLITFKEKVAREIMIPRIDVFALDATTSIKEACIKLLKENYSRIPVFEENLDNIVGVLMYKDLLEIYTKAEDNKKRLNEPIKNFLKPVIYAPENKKISKLLQEFKTKKMHLGIIVNEYGGTEGIVTIEDILEEVVGEIKDEYDIEEEKQFSQLPSGSIVIDAKMSIIDLEEQLKIKIPSSPEYETIGGYIFHIAGTIPTKGWKIHLEDFEIEVLDSTQRSIEKIRITPSKLKEN